jgi:hypothetical protein
VRAISTVDTVTPAVCTGVAFTFNLDHGISQDPVRSKVVPFSFDKSRTLAPGGLPLVNLDYLVRRDLEYFHRISLLEVDD